MGRLLHIIFFFMLYSVEPVDTSLLLHFFGVGGVNHAKTSRMGRLIIVFIFHFVFSGASGYLAAVALLWPAREPRAEVWRLFHLHGQPSDWGDFFLALKKSKTFNTLPYYGSGYHIHKNWCKHSKYSKQIKVVMLPIFLSASSFLCQFSVHLNMVGLIEYGFQSEKHKNNCDLVFCSLI